MQTIADKPIAIKQFTIKAVKQAIGGSIGEPSKMPGFAYGISAKKCKTGAKLAKIPGSVCSICYALHHHYEYPSVKLAHERRLEAWKEPGWTEAMIYYLRHEYAKLPEDQWYHRWFDSGDVQSLVMLRKIVAVCVALPHIHFWLPSKEYAIVKSYRLAHGEFPKNLVVRLSAHMLDQKPPDGYGLPTSTVFTHSVLRGEYECRAQYQEGRCGECRACWDRSVQTTSYPKHN
jgi:Gene product 88